MDYEINKIYSKLDNFGMVSGIDEIKKDMDALNTKINEYRNIAMLNNCQMPVVSLEMDSLNNEIKTKYSQSISNINVPQRQYTIKSFGHIDDMETRKLEDAISTLGRLAVKKICDHYNIACDTNVLNASNQEVVQYFNTHIVDKNIESEVSNKMSFKVSYDDNY